MRHPAVLAGAADRHPQPVGRHAGAEQRRGRVTILACRQPLDERLEQVVGQLDRAGPPRLRDRRTESHARRCSSRSPTRAASSSPTRTPARPAPGARAGTGPRAATRPPRRAPRSAARAPRVLPRQLHLHPIAGRVRRHLGEVEDHRERGDALPDRLARLPRPPRAGRSSATSAGRSVSIDRSPSNGSTRPSVVRCCTSVLSLDVDSRRLPASSDDTEQRRRGRLLERRDVRDAHAGELAGHPVAADPGLAHRAERAGVAGRSPRPWGRNITRLPDAVLHGAPCDPGVSHRMSRPRLRPQLAPRAVICTSSPSRRTTGGLPMKNPFGPLRS